ncbi:MAG: PP2C family protein-serine/threonine phosphatase [Propionibacteriaceae bacterium]
MPLTLRTVAHSEIGLVRKNNQDSGYASPTMVVVADGMGGAAAGDLASTVAITELQKADGHHTGPQMLAVLAGALQKANDRLAELVADDLALDGMGTTVCGALFDGEQLGVVHIGDSRGYLRRDDTLIRLTHDHSWVQSLIDEGRITEDESHVHPHRSLLLKVLNGQPISEPDLELFPLQAGDRIMFCSDGLCGLVTDDLIDDALAGDDLDLVLSDLVEAAHAGGGLDNITIIVSDVVEAGADDESAMASTVLTVPRTAARGLVLGAAVTREIPAIRSRPIDLGDGASTTAELTDGSGNLIPAAPLPLGTAGTERYEPEAGQRRRRLGLWGAIVAVVLVIAMAGYGTYAYAMTQFLIAPTGPQVGIYQGLQGGFLGVSTNRLVDSTGIQISDLPPAYQERVRAGIQVRSGGIAAAQAAVTELRTRSTQCVAQRLERSQATQTPTPTPTPTPAPTAGVTIPAATASPGASVTAAPASSASQSSTPQTSVSTGTLPTTVQTPSAPDEC